MTRRQKYRKNRYQRGLCSRCDSARRPEFVCCQKCADKDKYRFDKQVAKGLCRQCRKPRGITSSVKCSECSKNARLHRLKKIGLSDVEIELARIALNSHNGTCDSCGVAEPGGRGEWCLDHNEKVKKFRGIICCGCNSAIGHAQENSERLIQAAVYLKEKQR